jgi:hypothetical protein
LEKMPRFLRGFLLGRETMKPRKVEKTVACKMEQTLVEAIDVLAERQFRTRSDVIRQAALRVLAENGICPVTA